MPVIRAISLRNSWAKPFSGDGSPWSWYQAAMAGDFATDKQVKAMFKELCG
jgi:hypothetical protein